MSSENNFALRFILSDINIANINILIILHVNIYYSKKVHITKNI